MAAVVEAVHREQWGRLLAVLAQRLRSLDLAEDCLADAFAAAVETWARDGVPDRPEAWLLTVARRRGQDWLRHQAMAARKLPLLLVDEEAGPVDDWEARWDASSLRDERLRLLFTCCHPALAMPARIGLTLRCVAGLTTAEIARAFLVSEPTMAARITRAKRKIAAARIPYRVPPDAELPERLAGVLAVVYLVFNEGYAATSGREAVRRELCEEAIRLGRVLAALLPGTPEVLGLLALMLLQHSRRDARVDARGAIVLLPDQVRSRWDRAQVAEGLDLVRRAVRHGRAGRYLLEAAIAAEHARAASATGTDWYAISRLYEDLESLTGSPVVRLNRAVAVAAAEDPEAGLRLLDGLDNRLASYHLLPAVRADLLRRLGRTADAARECERALSLASNDAERALLARRLTELRQTGPGPQRGGDTGGAPGED